MKQPNNQPFQPIKPEIQTLAEILTANETTIIEQLSKQSLNDPNVWLMIIP